jgi:hypothetical protein
MYDRTKQCLDVRRVLWGLAGCGRTGRVGPGYGTGPVDPAGHPGATEECRTKGAGRVHGGAGGNSTGDGRGEGGVPADGYGGGLTDGTHVGGECKDAQHQEERQENLQQGVLPAEVGVAR